MLRALQGTKGNSHSLSTITLCKIDLKSKKLDLHFYQLIQLLTPCRQHGKDLNTGHKLSARSNLMLYSANKKAQINTFKNPESTVKAFQRQQNTSHLQPHPGPPSVHVCRGWQWRASQRSASGQRSGRALGQWSVFVCSSGHPTILARQSARNPGHNVLRGQKIEETQIYFLYIYI